MDSGKITGEAYMAKRIPKLTKYLKSLYFTVSEEKINPKPNPKEVPPGTRTQMLETHPQRVVEA